MHPLLPLLLWHMGRQAHGLPPGPMPPDFPDHVLNHPTFQGWQGGGSLGAPQPQPPMYGGIGGLLQARLAGGPPRLDLQPAPVQNGGIGGALAPYMPAMSPSGPIRM